MRVKRIQTGAENERYRLYSVCDTRGNSDLEKFLGKYADQAVAVLRCMSDAAEKGPHCLPKARVHLIDQKNKIYEFVGGRLRVAFFTDSDRIVVCSHGFLKSTQETPRQEKKKAAQARNLYLKAQASDTLTFDEGS